MDTKDQLKMLLEKGRDRRRQFGATIPPLDRQMTKAYTVDSSGRVFYLRI